VRFEAPAPLLDEWARRRFAAAEATAAGRAGIERDDARHGSAPSHHGLSSAAFTIIIAESNFRYT